MSSAEKKILLFQWKSKIDRFSFWRTRRN